MAAPELPPLPFREAIDALRAKLAVPTARWTDLWKGEHARAFAVAGALADDLVADFRDEIVKALEAGTSVRDWRATFEAIVTRHSWRGWTGEGTAKGRRWRARVIYDTNIRTSHAIGRWRQQQDGAARRPFLRYTAVLDGATRPEHRTWHGTILPIDHPWWQTHYPPNGWYCRCQAVQVSGRDIERRGWQVSTAAPAIDWRPVQVKGRGLVMTPAGIHPGFAYNPGAQAGPARGPAAPPPSPPPQRARATPGAVHQHAVGYVTERGKSDGFEHLFAYDEATGEVLSRVSSGRAMAVVLPADLEGPVSAPDRRVVIVHNHPDNSALSGPDLKMLGRKPGISRVVAVGHDGSTHDARAIPRFKPAMERLVDSARVGVNHGAQVAERDGFRVPHDVLGELLAYAICVVLSRVGAIDYRAEPSAPLREWAERVHKQAFDLAVAHGERVAMASVKKWLPEEPQ